MGRPRGTAGGVRQGGDAVGEEAQRPGRGDGRGAPDGGGTGGGGSSRATATRLRASRETATALPRRSRKPHGERRNLRLARAAPRLGWKLPIMPGDDTWVGAQVESN